MPGNINPSAAVPEGFSLIVRLYDAAKAVKIHKKRLGNLARQCDDLLSTVGEHSPRLIGTSASGEADEIVRAIERILNRVVVWAGYGDKAAFVKQNEIQFGIDECYRELSACSKRFEIALSLVDNCENRVREEARQRDHRQLYELLAVFLEEVRRSARTVVSEPPTLLPPQVIQDSSQQAVIAEARGGANHVVIPPRLRPADLSGKVSVNSGHTVIEGRFLDFYMGEWTNDGDLRFKEKVESWRGLHHRNVLGFFGHVKIEDIIYSVSPWMENGNIRDYVRGNPDADRMRLLGEVASGMEFLHENGIVHGDLCGKNVLISGDGKAFICGFNLSEFVNPTSDMSRARWLAPERISASVTSPTFKADVWSFGLLCLEVFTDADPYSPYSDLYVPVLLSQGKPPEDPGPAAVGLSPKMWELMQSCWEVNPEVRPDMDKIHLAMRNLLPRIARHPTLSPAQDQPTLVPPIDGSSQRETSRSSSEASSIPAPLTPPPTTRDLQLTPEPSTTTPPPPLSRLADTEVNGKSKRGSNISSPTSLRLTLIPPVDSGSSYERSRSSFESSSIPAPLTPPPINRGLQLTSEPSTMTTPLPPSRLADKEAAGWPKGGNSTSSPASARLPTLREDDHDPHNPNIPTPLSASAQSPTLSPLLFGRSKPSSRPSSAPNPSLHHVLAPGLQRHTSVDSTSSRGSTSTGESAPRPARKPSRWLPFPKRSRTSISETGDPATVPENSPKPLIRSRTNPAETSNAVPPPSRSASSLSILTPIRNWAPVSNQVLDSLEEAACDSESLLRPARDGSVSAGNLEGLISRVIAGSADPSRDERFKAAFLTIYQLFASSEQLFNILKRRFESAPLDPATARVRYNSMAIFIDPSPSILVFVESWLKKGFEDPELTCSSKIREFARSVSGSQTMEAKAREVGDLVDDPDHVRLRNPESCPRLRSEPVPHPPGVTPSDVANALTVIEGSRFERITYWDYVNFVRQRPNTRRIDVFNTVHDLIETWVQTTVLRLDFVDERMKKYEFWVSTAQACRKLNNFSSTSAIVTALLSPTITSLALTCESRATKQVLHGLAKELTPTDGSYRNVIRSSATMELIPWLSTIGPYFITTISHDSIDPHLVSLNSTFVQSNPIMEVDGHALVDFKLLSELAEQVESIVQFTPPRVEHATRQDILAYIEHSLKSITTGDASHASTDVLSAQLALDERRMLEHRARMRSLGIPWSPPRRK
ncbi:hypothetical protein EDB92DRAFT_1812453 [Lactarius akahatsu]|uniref:Non-specific serine/threonine protein kinase n=1 Tax=Lactarius akahatsu TaxID=416441 RepID=A0AAD4LSK6_9AGAM|nr:hypothetical protein EDB92DRAFT_1812453 [Lactarius akahatsu]